MIERVIFAFTYTSDYVNGKREELTNEAMGRIKTLYDRLAKGYYRKRFGSVRILHYYEGFNNDDLHARSFMAEMIKDLSGEFEPEIDTYVSFHGLKQEMRSIKSESKAFSVLLFINTESKIAEELIASWNTVALFEPRIEQMTKPPTKDHLAIIVDPDFKGMEWVDSSTFKNRPLTAPNSTP